MSTPEIPSISQRDVARYERIQGYIHTSALSVLLYDFTLTFGAEVHFIWRRPKTLSSYLYFLQRLLVVLAFIPTIDLLLNADIRPQNGFERCPSDVVENIATVVLVANEFFINFYLSLRICALYKQSRYVIAFATVSAVIAILIPCMLFLSNKQTGCDRFFAHEVSMMLLASWGFLILYESILFGLILYKVIKDKPHRLAGLGIGRRSSIRFLILRDGVLYYLVVIIFNVANVATFFLPQPFLRGCLSRLSGNISIIMMTRLVLNLHETADGDIGSYPSKISSLHFQASNFDDN